jgi:hypothetical protein
MHYRNLDMKLDQFVAYLNDDKINLIPPFQRGHVWSLPTRRKLITNVVQGRPIPAIFLYREAAGDKYEYNILDGKQRLESLILFIGNQRAALQVKDIAKYFFEKRIRDAANFRIQLGTKKQRQGLKDLDDQLFREFQEYIIPTIEIALSEDNPTALDEMINLFVDINSYGVQVKRFDIVKAMSKDALLRSTFRLLAQQEKRGKDVLYKAKNNEFTKVLKTLQIIDNLRDANSKVDRMWELVVELVLFVRTKKHRNPVEILKSFIRVAGEGQPKVSQLEQKQLRKIFRFLRVAYRNGALANSRLAVNQIHFYTMVTSIIAGNLLTTVPEDQLIAKLARFGQIIDGKEPAPRGLRKVIERYKELSEKQTTHVSRREERQEKFLDAIDEL